MIRLEAIILYIEVKITFLERYNTQNTAHTREEIRTQLKRRRLCGLHRGSGDTKNTIYMICAALIIIACLQLSISLRSLRYLASIMFICFVARSVFICGGFHVAVESFGGRGRYIHLLLYLHLAEFSIIAIVDFWLLDACYGMR